ncbi:hypothetical protein MESS4_260003 [Mesorhizobium sp. STM 4661]|nr:hypothetical protein MESS4_260003 [Mesorhizobium sp. STM 4661]
MKTQRFGLIESSARGASSVRGDCAEDDLAEIPELRGADANRNKRTALEASGKPSDPNPAGC